MFSRYSLPLRNLRYYWRGNLAVLMGVAVGAAVLAGALFVGDSLRGSLRERADRQTNGVVASWTGSRLISAAAAEKLPGGVIPAIILQGSATTDRPNDSDPARLARVTVLGVPDQARIPFHLPVGSNRDGDSATAVVSARVADRLGLKAGERFKIAVQQLSTVPRASLLGRRGAEDLTTTLTLTAAAILSVEDAAGDFALAPSPTAALNIYVPLALLQQRLARPGRANALFSVDTSAAELNAKLASALTPADLGLRIGVPTTRKAYVSVEAEQLILDSPSVTAIEEAAKAIGATSERTTTYLANWIAADEAHRIPYSIVAALNPAAGEPLGPFLPAGVAELKDGEIVLADWPDSPLKAVPVGAAITLTYFEPEIEAGPVEATATFTLRGRIPLTGPARDPDLTPPFPGITDKPSIGNWNPPFPFVSSRIKPNDENERFWNAYKTTPKAYIARAAGERLFGSRFGVTTSIRVAPRPGEIPDQTAASLASALAATLPPEKLGIVFADTATRNSEASRGGTDFSILFLGFSCILIAAALLLVGLLVRLNVERRAKAIGSLLASGYTPKLVLRFLVIENLILALVGALLGVLAAIAYSRFLVDFLADLWPDATVKTYLRPHASWGSALSGGLATTEMTLITVWIALRKLVKVPPPALLRGQTTSSEATIGGGRAFGGAIAIGLLIVPGLGLLAFGTTQSNPDFQAGSFFGGGFLLFDGGALFIRRWLGHESGGFTNLGTFGRRNAGRFRGRSMLTVLLIGAATFLLVAVESFRRSPDAAFAAKTGGSGGYNLIADADVPLFNIFDREPGRGEFLDLLKAEYQRLPATGPSPEERTRSAEEVLKRIAAVAPLRVRGGDDASCLNLYQAGAPRLVGVPQMLIDRGGFRFNETEASTPEETANPWLLLAKPREDGAIPVFGEQNSVMWMLKKAVGDEITLPGETGVPTRFRIVGTVQDSIFQSDLLCHEAAFRKVYPREEGFKQFLIDAPAADEPALRRVLETGLRINGLTVEASRDRVAAYQAVIGTYLTTFQLLGGMGLLLGIVGLAVVLLRGIWERAGELALLRAVGYSPPAIRRLILAENLLLLALGVALGLVTAGLSVAPHLLLGGQWPWRGVAVLIGGVAVAGVLAVLFASAGATRMPILAALRKE